VLLMYSLEWAGKWVEPEVVLTWQSSMGGVVMWTVLVCVEVGIGRGFGRVRLRSQRSLVGWAGGCGQPWRWNCSVLQRGAEFGVTFGLPSLVLVWVGQGEWFSASSLEVQNHLHSRPEEKLVQEILYV
jgi:hypothetical protein